MGKKALEDQVAEGERNRDMYNGKILLERSIDSVEPNYVYVDYHQSKAALYSKDPKIFFTPKKPEAEKACEIFEILVNQKWEQRKMKQVVREAVGAAKLDTMVAFKTYFYYSDHVDEWDDRIENDDVRTDVVLIKNLIKDPDSPSWKKSPWIAHEVSATIQDIADKFGIRKKDDIVVTSSTAGSVALPDNERYPFQYGRYWEIEDRRNGQLFYIVDGIQDKVFDLKDKKYPYDSMYNFISYNEISGTSEVHSDYYFWKKQLGEVAMYRTAMAQHAKKGSSKYIGVGADFSDTQIAALQSGDDTVFVQLQPNQQVTALSHANLDPSINQAMNLAIQDIQLISKQAPRQSGQEKTATEVKAVEMAAREVSNERLELLEDVMASIATKWAKLMHKNYDKTRVINLTEMDEAKFQGFKERFKDSVEGTSNSAFMSVTKESLSDQVVAGVRAGSTLPDSDQTRVERLLNFGKYVQMINAAAYIDIEEALDEGIKAFGLENDNILKDKDNPYQENELLKSGILVQVKLSDDDEYHIGIHKQLNSGTPEEMMHIMTHEMQKKQKDDQKQYEMQKVMSMQTGPMGMTSGQSFMGLGNSGPLPPSDLGGGVPPQVPVGQGV